MICLQISILVNRVQFREKYIITHNCNRSVNLVRLNLLPVMSKLMASSTTFIRSVHLGYNTKRMTMRRKNMLFCFAARSFFAILLHVASS